MSSKFWLRSHPQSMRIQFPIGMKSMERVVAIYARVSSRKQKESETIQSQLDALRQYADDNQFTILNDLICIDDGFSGSILDRPGLDKLRDCISERCINTVLVYSPDRLSRKYVHQLVLKDEFEKQGASIIFLKSPTAKTPEEQLSLHFQGIFAEYERTQIAERCRRGRLYKAKAGSHSVLSTASYGYKRVNGGHTIQFEIDEDKAKVVRQIFNLFTRQSRSVYKICMQLESEGVIAPRGGSHWHPGTVRDILLNSSYQGLAYYGKTEKYDGVPGRVTRYGKNKKIKPTKTVKASSEDKWIGIPIPAIVTVEEFEVAAKLLNKNKERSARNTKRPSILQSLIVCSVCGGTYYKKERKSGKNGRWSFYVCKSSLMRHLKPCGNRSIHQETLDSRIWEEVLNMLKNPELIEQEVQRRIEENPEVNKNRAKAGDLEKELHSLERARNKLLDAYQDGESLTLNDLKTRMGVLEKRKKALERDQESLNALKIHQERLKDFKLSLSSFVEKLNANEKNINIEERQKIVRMLIDEIVVEKDGIKVMHCIPIKPEMYKNGQLSSVRLVAHSETGQIQN
jgi:site-specific DNA recombinase